MSQDRCPDRDILRKLLLGELSESAPSALERHLADCPDCCARLREADPEGNLVKAFRAGAFLSSVIDPDVERLMARIESLGGIDAPPTAADGAWLKGACSGQTPVDGRPVGPLLPPVSVPGYEILEELGRGGMGVVYKARQVALDRIVALKMILAGDLARPEQRERFQVEALTTARLGHPNIVAVYEVGESSGRPFLALEHCSGGSLEARLRQGPLPPEQAARLVQPLAQAVHAAHQAQVIHRDLKPANVLLAVGNALGGVPEGSGTPPRAFPTDVVPKITDFGLAKRLDAGDGPTRDGALLGTPSYMAPEQAESRTSDIGPAADVYSLGAILYECLTGRPPFKAATVMDTLRQVIDEPPAAVRLLQPAVPADLETICLKCLHKDPAKRYPSAQELADDLGRFLRREPVRARPVSPWESGVSWCRRNPAVAGLLVGVAGLLVGIAVVSSVLGRVAWLKAQDAEAQADEARRAREREAAKAAEERLARAEVVAAREEAKTKALQEEQTRQKADAEVKRTKSLRYSSHRALVLRFWAEGNILAVRDNLDLAQENPDSWEHRYLCTLLNHLGQSTFLGHSQGVTGVAFSPDGKHIASSSWDQTVRVWDSSTGRQLLSLNGHTAATSNVSFSPDGKRLASSSWDQTVRVWDSSTGRQLLLLTGHTQPVNSVCFSPDGQWIASGSHDQTVRLHDARTGRRLLVLGGNRRGARSVAFSPDGRRIAAARGDRLVKVWDARTGEELLTLAGHTKVVNSVCFSPDGTQIASSSGDNHHDRRPGEVIVWNSAGKQIRALEGHSGPVLGVSFSPDGRRLAAASGCLLRSVPAAVKVWDVGSGREVLSLKGHNVIASCVSFSPDGKRIASGSWDKTVRIWNAAGGQETRTLVGHSNRIWCVAVSPDSTRVASASEDGTVRLHDARTGRHLLSLPHRTKVHSVSFSPDGKWIASGDNENAVKLCDARTGKLIRSFEEHTRAVASVCFSRDGKLLASSSYDGTAKIQEVATGRCLATLRGHPGPIWSISFSPEGGRLVTGDRGHAVMVWDAKTGRRLHWLKDPTSITCVAWSPDGKQIAAGSDDHTIKLWDARTWKLIRSLTGHTHSVYGVAFSSDSKRLASASNDWTVKIWDAESGDDLLTLVGHEREVNSVAFSPDGSFLASAGGDQAVRLWDAHPHQETVVLKGHKALVRAAVWSPDGKLLVSTAEDSTAKIWDPDTGRELKTLKGHKSSVLCASWSPDGKRVATGAGLAPWNGRAEKPAAWRPDGKRSLPGSGEVRVWDAQTGRQLLLLDGVESVNSVCFSSDGKWIASAGDDWTVWLWDAQSGKLIRSLVGHTQPVTGVCFGRDDRTVVSRTINGEQITWDPSTGRRTGARSVYREASSPLSPDGRSFAITEDQMIRVHRLPRGTRPGESVHPGGADPGERWQAEQAEQSWREGNWFAAQFHLTRQLLDRPEDARLHVRRGYALSRLGRRSEAAEEFRRANSLNPNLSTWPIDDEAGKRGHKAAESGNWPLAADELELAAHQPGATLDDWESLRLGRSAAGQKGAGNCREVLDRFENLRTLSVALLNICTAVPFGEEDGRRIARVAQRLADRGGERRLAAVGMACYRLGEWSKAAGKLQQALQVHGSGGSPDVWLFLALAQQRLGRMEEARKLLARAEEWLRERKFPTWQETTRWRLLHEEARRLILAMPGSSE